MTTLTLEEARKKEDELRLQLRETERERLELELAADAAYKEQFEKVLLDELRQNHDLLNFLAPEHERTSCCDNNPCNVERHGAIDCTRCALLTWMECPAMALPSFRVEFRLNRVHREDLDGTQ